MMIGIQDFLAKSDDDGNDSGQGFCSRMLEINPSADNFSFVQVGIIPFIGGLLDLVSALVVIFWIHVNERRALVDGGDQAAKSVIFPAFKQFLWLSLFVYVWEGLTEAFMNPDRLPHDWFSAFYVSIFNSLRHCVIDGVAFLLLQKGCGKNAAKTALYYAMIWAIVIFVITFTLLATTGDSSEVYSIYNATKDFVTFLFYFFLWITPQDLLFRRPSLTYYSQFWATYRLCSFAQYFLMSIPKEREPANCSVLFLIVFLNPWQPLVCYWTLLMDSQWWQGIEIYKPLSSTRRRRQRRRPSYENIRENLEGADFTPDSAQDLADTIDRIMAEENVQMLNFACIKVNLNDPTAYLGGGSFSRVYQGSYRGKQCAIKLIRTADLTKDIIRKVAAEASILSSISDPHIVNILGISVLPPSVCILLELCEFGSLSDLIRGYGFEWNVQALPPLTISWLDRLYFALGCARGLAAVHSIDRHICHRDVKSFNFLVNSHFVVKIADLELGVLRSREPLKVIPPAHSLAAPAYAALPVSPSSHLSSSSSSNPTELVGAVSDRTLVDVENLLPNWLAPEVIINKRFRQASDIYALGTVFWEIFSGQLPFEHETRPEVIRQKIVAGEKLPLPGDIVETPVGKLIQTCWLYDPEYRPTAAEICRRLEQLLETAFLDLVRDQSAQNVPDFSVLESFYDFTYRLARATAAPSVVSAGVGRGSASVRGSFLDPLGWFRPSGGREEMRSPLLSSPARRGTSSAARYSRVDQNDPDEEVAESGESFSSDRGVSADFYSPAPPQLRASRAFDRLRLPFLSAGSLKAVDETNLSEYALPFPSGLSSSGGTGMGGGLVEGLAMALPPAAQTAIHLVKQEAFCSQLEHSGEAWAIFTPTHPFIQVHGTSRFYELFNVPSSFGRDYHLLSLASLLFPDYEAVPACCRHSNAIVEKAVLADSFRAMRFAHAQRFLARLRELSQGHGQGQGESSSLHDIVLFHLPFLSLFRRTASTTTAAGNRPVSSASLSFSRLGRSFDSVDSAATDHLPGPQLGGGDRIRGYNLMASVHVYPVYPPAPSPPGPGPAQGPGPAAADGLGPEELPAENQPAAGGEQKAEEAAGPSLSFMKKRSARKTSTATATAPRQPMYLAILFNELREQPLVPRALSTASASQRRAASRSSRAASSFSQRQVTDEEALALTLLEEADDRDSSSWRSSHNSHGLAGTQSAQPPQGPSAGEDDAAGRLWSRISRFWTLRPQPGAASAVTEETRERRKRRGQSMDSGLGL